MAIKTILLLCFISQTVQAQNCPKSDPAKACPIGGNTILDDTYPASSVVISRGQLLGSGISLAESIVENLDTENIPNLILSGWNQTEYDKFLMVIKQKYPKKYETVKTKVTKLNFEVTQYDENFILDYSNIFPQYKKTYTPQATNQIGSNFQWVQDIFQSSFDPATGNAVIHSVDKPFNEENQAIIDSKFTQKLTTSLNSQSCSHGEKIGTSLKLGNELSIGARQGGNFEALPGGVCFTSTSMPSEALKSLCPNDKRVFKMKNVDWMKVGHVDELVNVVPNPKAKCGFSLVVASPKLALDLLAKSKTMQKYQNTLFQSLPNDDQHPSSKEAKDLCKSWNSYLNSIGEPKTPDENNIKGLKASGIFSFVPSANAGGDTVTTEPKVKDPCLENTKLLTSDQAYTAIINDRKTYDVNMIMQENIDQTVNELRNYYSTNKMCAALDVVQVPQIFSGKTIEKSEGKIQTTLANGQKISKNIEDLTYDEKNLIPSSERYKLLYQGLVTTSVTSINPSPVNGLSLSNNFFGSKQFNPIFQDYLSSKFDGKSGLPRYVAIDNWVDAHVKNGGVHCSTNALRYCSPKKSKTF